MGLYEMIASLDDIVEPGNSVGNNDCVLPDVCLREPGRRYVDGLDCLVDVPGSLFDILNARM
jgi:hypothetical protein